MMHDVVLRRCARGYLVAGATSAQQAREDILASAQGHELARQQVEAAIVFLEFLAGGAFSSEERRAIIEESRAEFVRDPVGDLKVYASIEEAASALQPSNMTRSRRRNSARTRLPPSISTSSRSRQQTRQRAIRACSGASRSSPRSDVAARRHRRGSTRCLMQ